MVYTLVIVESPAKTGSFEKILGPGYKCMASFGHIRELKGLKSINKEQNYKPSFTNSLAKIKQIKKLQEAVKSASSVLLATDDDREGEAIAWHLCCVLKLDENTTPRLIFHEITPEAIRQAVRNPSTINMDKVRAQQARQVLDILVGYQISPLLWRQFGGQLSLSAGRCQTPALRLVYENECEIEKSPGKIVYTTTGIFTVKALTFTLDKQYESEGEMGMFLENTVESEHKHMLVIDKQGTATKAPPKPFTTSTMQQAANSELHISPKEAMSICQKLYEAGLITYMRTDSKTYSKEFINKAKDYITEKYGRDEINPQINSLSQRSSEGSKPKEKKVSKKQKEKKAQEAHEAIRPTNISHDKIDSSKFSPKERKMYHMIWRNSVESCMRPCLVQTVSASISAPDNGSYRCSQEEIVEPGWKLVAGYEKANHSYRYLVSLKDVCPIEVKYSKINSRLGIKDTKQHYTEAKLVQLLEEKGIGRPSTFSSLIDKIQERGYVKREDVDGRLHKGIEFELRGDELVETEVEKKFGGERNKLVLQPIGKMAWEFLRTVCLPLFEYDYTREMEEKLDIVASGHKIWYELCGECDREIMLYTESVNTANSLPEKDIVIDDNHAYTITKYGPAIVSTENGKKVYKSAKKDLDLDKLREGKLQLEDIIDEEKQNGKELGVFEGKSVYLKTGKFGMYIQCGEKNISVKKLAKKASDITLEKVLPLLEASKEPTRFRKLNDDYSVRVGKTPYIFFKTKKMKKPQFMNLKGFDEDPFECERAILLAWLETHHKIKIE